MAKLLTREDQLADRYLDPEDSACGTSRGIFLVVWFDLERRSSQDSRREQAQRHEVYYLWRGHADDPEDAHVLEAAIAAQASRLVPFNTGDFTDTSQLGIEVMTPGEFLRTVE